MLNVEDRQFISFVACINICKTFATRKPCCHMRKPRDAAAVLFGLKFADNIHYKFKSSRASKAASELQTYRRKIEFNTK